MCIPTYPCVYIYAMNSEYIRKANIHFLYICVKNYINKTKNFANPQRRKTEKKKYEKRIYVLFSGCYNMKWKHKFHWMYNIVLSYPFFKSTLYSFILFFSLILTYTIHYIYIYAQYIQHGVYTTHTSWQHLDNFDNFHNAADS